eukprot:sb/3467482/
MQLCNVLTAPPSQSCVAAATVGWSSEGVSPDYPAGTEPMKDTRNVGNNYPTHDNRIQTVSTILYPCVLSDLYNYVLSMTAIYPPVQYKKNGESFSTNSHDTTTTYTTTPPVAFKELYSIEYEESTRRGGKTIVKVKLVPNGTFSLSTTPSLTCLIEYSKRIRRIRKVWGGTAKFVERKVIFTTHRPNGIIRGALSLVRCSHVTRFNAPDWFREERRNGSGQCSDRRHNLEEAWWLSLSRKVPRNTKSQSSLINFLLISWREEERERGRERERDHQQQHMLLQYRSSSSMSYSIRE